MRICVYRQRRLKKLINSKLNYEIVHLVSYFKKNIVIIIIESQITMDVDITSFNFSDWYYHYWTIIYFNFNTM